MDSSVISQHAIVVPGEAPETDESDDDETGAMKHNNRLAYEYDTRKNASAMHQSERIYESSVGFAKFIPIKIFSFILNYNNFYISSPQHSRLYESNRALNDHIKTVVQKATRQPATEMQKVGKSIVHTHGVVQVNTCLSTPTFYART
jgi:hypothetical protein